MSLINSTTINTNPACAGYGPLEPASEPFRSAQLGVSLVLVLVMVITAGLTLYMRNYRRRLRVKSPVPVLFGSFGGLTLILIRAGFDYQGREYFPCTLDVTLYYFVLPLAVISDSVASAVFLAKQYQRQLLNAKTLQVIEQRVQDKGQRQERKCATPLEFFEGLWDFQLAIITLVFFVDLDKKYFFHAVRKPSVFRETAYEMLSVGVFSLPFFIALTIRIAVTPHYQPQNGCTGCIVMWQDVLINCFLVFALLIPVAGITYKVRRFNIPDPLLSVVDMYRGLSFGFPILVASSVLLALDPGNAMKNQQMDWHYLELILVWTLHMQRTSFQLWRTRRIQKLAEKNINLIDILSDPRASLLFEKHLIGELANENLLFWREAIKYKHAFDRNGDFDYSQQMAKILWRTFLSPHATLPINISDSIKRTIDSRFKGGVVGKAVFDEGLAEVYLMMQNGAFQRFIHSEPFKDFMATKADFSMATMVTPMSIVPSVDDGVSTTIHIDIKEYIKSI